MALFVVLALIGTPLLEIAVFIRVGGVLGVGLTLGMTVFTAVFGIFMVRAQGLSTVFKLRESLDRGEMPLRAVFDGACQLIAGALLLIPGFVTDFAGLLLFIPALRLFLLNRLLASASITVVGTSTTTDGHSARQAYDLDADYTDVTPADRPALDNEQDEERR